jgi:hypothetical protein
MSVLFPLLNQPSSAGTAKLQGRFTQRLASGTESGRRVLDLELVHVCDADALERAEEVLPGLTAAAAAAAGEDGSGGRKYEWAPATAGKTEWKGEARIVICPEGGGVKIYEGAATVRGLAAKAHQEGVTAVLKVRLHDVDPEADEPKLSLAMGSVVDYEIEQRIGQPQPVSEDDPRQTSLLDVAQGGQSAPETGAEIGPRDLVAWLKPETDDQPSEEGAGIVVSTAADHLILHTRIGGPIVDASGSPVVEIQRSWVTSSFPLCGAKGGNPALPLKQFGKAATEAQVDLSAADLLAALLDASDRGLIDRCPEGWPLTAEVRDLALAAAAVLPEEV